MTIVGRGASAALSHECVTKRETRGGPAWQAWAAAPGDYAAMAVWFANADHMKHTYKQITGILVNETEAQQEAREQKAAKKHASAV